MARLAYERLGKRRASVLAVNLDYGVGLMRVFKEAFEGLGGSLPAIEYYDQGATDLRTQLTKIRASAPDCVYLPGYYAEIGLALRQSMELGLRCQFLSCVGFDNPKVLEIAGEAAEGVIFARPYYNPESQDMKIRAFVQDFAKAYGVSPGIYAAHAYDALRILVEAIRSGGYSADGIKDALYSIRDFPGVTGSTSFDANGDVVKPIQIMQVKNGAFTVYE
jgi:branched-chain amino acid transport system substrate-binding protein